MTTINFDEFLRRQTRICSSVPTRGNSTKQTLTRLRPGALSPGGEGVEVKHGSYERYLLKLKGKTNKCDICETIEESNVKISP